MGFSRYSQIHFIFSLTKLLRTCANISEQLKSGFHNVLAFLCDIIALKKNIEACSYKNYQKIVPITIISWSFWYHRTLKWREGEFSLWHWIMASQACWYRVDDVVACPINISPKIHFINVSHFIWDTMCRASWLSFASFLFIRGVSKKTP